jgi:hypothetical protein
LFNLKWLISGGSLISAIAVSTSGDTEMTADPNVLLQLIEDYGVLAVIAGFLFYQQWQDKKANAKELAAWREASVSRITKLEKYQEEDAAKQRKELYNALDRSNRCIETSTTTMQNLVTSVINR